MMLSSAHAVLAPKTHISIDCNPLFKYRKYVELSANIESIHNAEHHLSAGLNIAPGIVYLWRTK